MADPTRNEVHELSLDRLKERLRQERETFDQHKAQENTWFILRVVIAGIAMPTLLAIAYASGRIIFSYADFTPAIVTAAVAAFFVDTVGLVVSVVKVVFNPDFITKLAPVTSLDAAEMRVLDDSRAAPTIAGEELVILSARYGTGNSWMDVAPVLRTRVHDARLQLKVENGELGGDPAEGLLKDLQLAYSYKGRTYSKSVAEHAELTVPEQ